MARAVIVVPCYNEEHRLDVDCYERFVRESDDIEILFVNDGSRDNTLAVLERLAGRQPRRVGVLNLERNGGKAEAVRLGLLAAIARRPRYVGFWDADLATPLDDIPRFCEVFERRPETRLVIGSRLPLLGHAIERRRARALAGRLFSLAASAALGVRIRDTQCGAKLLRATPCLADLFADPFVSRWIFDVEILARLTRYRRDNRGGRLDRLVYEYALDRWRDVQGSKVLAGDFSKAAMDLATIYWIYLRPGAGWRPSTHAAPAPRPIVLHPAHEPLAGDHRAIELPAPLATASEEPKRLPDEGDRRAA